MDKNPALTDDLLALAAMRDEDIDTTEISEQTNFSRRETGKYYDLEARHYDVRAIANWCLDKAESNGFHPTSMWINKIVYFIYETALQNFRIVLTPAKIEAWDHGPVFRELYAQFQSDAPFHKLKKMNLQTRQREDAAEDFRELDLKIFDNAWKKYGHLSAAELRRISHQSGSPWDIAWHSGGKSNPGMGIDIGVILGRNSYPDDGKQRN